MSKRKIYNNIIKTICIKIIGKLYFIILGILMLNYVNDFWNGKIKLWKSYWIVGEILNALVILLIFNIEVSFLNNQIIENFLPFFNFQDFNFLNKILLILWTIFITIGIWRSAENYKGNIIWIVLTLIFLSYRVFTLRIIFFN